LRPILWQLTETVARRMKKAGVLGRGVTLKLKTADFRLLTRSRRLGGPTRSAETMYGVAERLLTREADGRAFRLIGVGAHNLVDADESPQGELLGDGQAHSPVDRALDSVREKFGDAAIAKGRGFGVNLKRQGPSKVD